MQVLKISGISILALGLVLGLALPTLAAPDAPKAWAEDFLGQTVRGKVTSVDQGNQEFVIKAGEEEVTIKVDGNTKYFKICVPGRITSLAQHWMQFRHQEQEEIGAPGGQGVGLGLQNQERHRALVRDQMRLRLQNQTSQPENVPLSEPQQAKLKWLCPFGEEAGFSDIAVGDMVVVWLASEGGNLAERVQIIEPVTYAHVSGTISDVSTDSITITPDDGDAVTLSYNEDTIFTLKGIIQVQSGQSANAIYDSDNMLTKVVTVN